MATPLADEFRRDADTEADQSSGSRLVSAAVLLEHIAQTQEVLRMSCIDLSVILLGMADEPRIRSRFTVIRGAFSRANGTPPPPSPPDPAAGYATTEDSAPYVVTE